MCMYNGAFMDGQVKILPNINFSMKVFFKTMLAISFDT